MHLQRSKLFVQIMHHKKVTPFSLTKFKMQKNYCGRLCKKTGKTFLIFLIQLGSVTIKGYEKIYDPFSVKNER